MTIDEPMKRLFILDPNIQVLTGHYLTYANSLASAARAKGIPCSILGHVNIDPQLAISYDVIPSFRSDIWRSATGTDYFSDTNLKIINREFFEDAVRALSHRCLIKGDTIFYPTLTAGQIAGIADLVDHFGGSGIRHEILLRYPASFFRGEVAAEALRRLEFASENEQIQFSSDSHRLAYELGSITTQQIAIYPIPHTNDHTSTHEEYPNDRVLHLVSLGNARGEKGFEEILEVIRRSADMPWGSRLRFTLQTNDPSEDVAGSLATFASNPDARTTLISDALDASKYTEVLRSADVVLLPYHRDIYTARTSGIFVEASAVGKVVLATSDTWMADLVQTFGNGLLVQDRSVQDLIQALQTLLLRFPDIAKRARSAAPKFRAVHNPDNLLEHVLGRGCISAEPSHSKRAAILYPWGDITGRSGAAARATILAKYLAEKGYQVRILYLGEEDVTLAPGVSAEYYNPDSRQSRLLRNSTKSLVTSSCELAPDLDIHLYLHLLPRMDKYFRCRLLRLIRWADRIFCEYTYFSDVAAQMSSVENKPYILTAYDLVSEAVRGIEPLYGLVRAMELMSLRSAGRVVVCSDLEADECLRDGIPVTTIPHPIDLEALRNHDSGTLKGILAGIFGIPLVDSFLCLFVGSGYDPNRTAANEIRAMAARAASDPRLQRVIFVVAGQAHKVERTENFIALGRVEDVTLDLLYQAASVVLIPLSRGTGMSVKTVEALARGAAIISTQIGVRGYPVINGRHCIIEDELKRYPNLIASLLEQPMRLQDLRKEARNLGASYDYRVIFEAYNVPAEPDLTPAIEQAAHNLAELLPRFQAGGGTAEGLQWLLRKLPITTLDLDHLVALAASLQRLLPSDPLSQTVMDTIRDRQPKSLDELFTKWLWLNECEEKTQSYAQFSNDMAAQLQAGEGRSVSEMRRNMWRLFTAGHDELLMRACQVFISSKDSLMDPEVCYCYALVKERVGDPRPEIIAYLTAALDKGFDPAWPLFHRGRLRLSEGDAGGREDLERAVLLGGNAAIEARALLATQGIDAVWRCFHAGDHAEAARLAEALLRDGATDPAINYVLGLSLHSVGIRLGEALDHYNTALDKGFDPAWPLFHRGRLKLGLGDPTGLDDLERSKALGGDAGQEAKRALETDGGVKVANERGHRRPLANRIRFWS